MRKAGMDDPLPDSSPFYDPLDIPVQDDVDRAIRELKKRINREGILKDLKMRRYYEKPSEKKKRKIKEAEKRRKKLLRRKIRKQQQMERKIRSL